MTPTLPSQKMKAKLLSQRSETFVAFPTAFPVLPLQPSCSFSVTTRYSFYWNVFPSPLIPNLSTWKTLIHPSRFTPGHTSYEKPFQCSQTLLLPLLFPRHWKHVSGSTCHLARCFILTPSLSTCSPGRQGPRLEGWPCLPVSQHLPNTVPDREKAG